MSVPHLRVIRWGAERARSGPWQGDPGLAHLVPTTDGRPLSEDFLRHCTRQLREDGFQGVVTSALAPMEQTPFLHVGFTVEQHLHLLAHDLADVASRPVPAGVRLRRSRPADLPEIVRLDAAAFDSFWTMDAIGLHDAVDATPRARFHVAVTSTSVVGYAIIGRAGRKGYLQRLAVAGEHTGHGIGQELVADGLRWLHRRGAASCLVNTQVGNQRALDLYERMGFRRQASGLAVLGIRLTP